MNYYSTLEEFNQRKTKDKYLLEVASEKYFKNGDYDMWIDSIYYSSNDKQKLINIANNLVFPVVNGYGRSVFFYELDLNDENIIDVWSAK